MLAMATRGEYYDRCSVAAVVDIGTGIDFGVGVELEAVVVIETETGNFDSEDTPGRHAVSCRCRRTWSELIIATRKRNARGANASTYENKAMGNGDLSRLFTQVFG